MTDQVLVFNFKLFAPDAIETAYIAPATDNGTKIKAFTATNDTTSSKWYKAYIYSASGVPVGSVVPQTIVVRDRSDHGAGAVNQVIPSGGSLRIESNAADALNFYVTGTPQ